MDDNKEKIRNRIKALLAMTEAAGCSENEALVAIAKASALMAEHQITMTEDEVVKEGFETTARHWQDKRNAFARYHLAMGIANYCDCKVWTSKELSGNKGLRFFGLSSDAQYAGWLSDSLADFVTRKADDHIQDRLFEIVSATGLSARQAKTSIKAELPAMFESFVLGCCHRINERLRESKPVQQVKASSSSTALVILDKKALVNAELARKGMSFSKGRAKKSKGHNGGSYHVGREAGNSANLNRPLGNSSKASAGYLR